MKMRCNNCNYIGAPNNGVCVKCKGSVLIQYIPKNVRIKTCEEIYDNILKRYMVLLSPEISVGVLAEGKALRFANCQAVIETPQAWRDQWKQCETVANPELDNIDRPDRHNIAGGMNKPPLEHMYDAEEHH